MLNVEISKSRHHSFNGDHIDLRTLTGSYSRGIMITNKWADTARLHYRRILYATMVCLFVPAIVFAQAEHVPANHPVYDFLNRMQILGEIQSYSRSVLPLERKEVTLYLRRLTAANLNLSGTDRALLDKYAVEFISEADGVQQRAELFAAHDSFGNFVDDLFSDKMKYLYTWASSDRSTTFFMEFLGSAEYRTILQKGSANNVSLGQVGGSFRGTIGGIVGYGLQSTNGTTFGSRALALTDRILRQNANYSDWHNQFFDQTEAYVSATWNWGSVSLGKEQVACGPGVSNKTFISTNAPLFDAFQFHLHVADLRFSFLQGFLQSTKELIENSRPYYPDKFLVMHRIEADLFSAVRFGVTEVVVYSQRSLDPAYLNPFNFYKSAEHAGGDRDNPMLGFDLQSISLRGTQVYGSWVIDDVDFSKMGTGWWGNKFIWQAGIQNHSLLANTELLLEYSHVEPYVFTHFFNNNEYTNKADVLSFEIPPNSDEWFARIRHWIGSKVLLSITCQYRRHGLNEYSADGTLLINHGGVANERFVNGRDDVIARFLDGPRETQSIVTSSIRYEPIRNFVFDLSYRFRTIWQPAQDAVTDHFVSLLFELAY